jgi:hypothetical protein
MTARDILKLIYKCCMIAATITLLALAFLAYRTATPGNGQLLISGILMILALMSFLSIWKLDWQDEQAETYRGILGEMRSLIPNSININKGGLPAGGKSEWTTAEGTPVSIQFAAPEVYRLDADAVEAAKRMAAEGRPIDDICRLIDPGYDGQDAMYQTAFQQVVRAMLDA